MSKTQNLLLILIILGITVACASTSDGSLGSVPSRTAAGKTIPTFIRDEFVEIRGSETILGQLKENVSFSTSSTVNYTTEVAAINTFQILRRKGKEAMPFTPIMRLDKKLSFTLTNSRAYAGFESDDEEHYKFIKKSLPYPFNFFRENE